MHCAFASVNLHQDESVLILSSKHKYVHLKTHWASHTMHQNLAIILRKFNYGKNSFKEIDLEIDGTYGLK